MTNVSGEFSRKNGSTPAYACPGALRMHKTMNKPVVTNNLKEKKSIESIKLHLTEQFHLPKEQIDMLLPSFIATLGVHMGNLENALADNNPTQLGKVGHTIKGAFLNLGLQDCAQIAFSIEEKVHLGGTLEDFKKLVEELQVLIRPVLDQDFVLKTLD